MPAAQAVARGRTTLREGGGNMARTGTRGWKGCAMCKYYKDRAFGDPVRIPASALRRMGGRAKRVSRNGISRAEREG
jgi:hypothetical protein